MSNSISQEAIRTLKNTVLGHRTDGTWEAFQRRTLRQWEADHRGYGRFIESTLANAPAQERDGIFLFAYLVNELSMLREASRETNLSWQGGKTHFEKNFGQLRSPTNAVGVNAEVVIDEFTGLLHERPNATEVALEELAADQPELSHTLRQYIQDPYWQLTEKQKQLVAAVALATNETTRTKHDPSYFLEEDEKPAII